jgi:hypothetical protein
MDEFEPLNDHEMELIDNTNMYLERSLTCTLALWSTLAGIDGVFVSAASIVASFSNNTEPWLLFGILICCSISLLCLLLNFHSLRHLYRVLATPPPADESALKVFDAWIHEQKRQIPRRRCNCDRRENFCYFLLTITVVLIAVWIFAKF